MEGLSKRKKHLGVYIGIQKVLKASTKVLSDGKNFCSKAAIVLGDIKYNERSRSKEGLASRLEATPISKFFSYSRISIFEASLSLSSFACCNQNCRVFRSRCSLRLAARNCSFAARIFSFSLSLFRRALSHFLKSIIRVY